MEKIDEQVYYNSHAYIKYEKVNKCEVKYE